MTRRILLPSLLLPLALPWADAAARDLVGYAVRDGQIEIRASDGAYFIRSYSPQIVETSFVPAGEVLPSGRATSVSHAVVLPPGPLLGQVHDTGSAIVYATPGITVTVDKSPLKIRYSWKGKPLLAEEAGHARRDGAETLSFAIDADEALYGGGARALGMDRRGHRLRLYNRAHYGYETRSELMNYTMPLVLSSKRYAVHFDNPAVGWLDLDSQRRNVLTYEVIGGRKTWQVIAGDDWNDVVGAWTALTGRQPLPPRWALGNFASRFGYHSEAEARATLAKFRQEKIPVDAIIFDLYWFGREVKGTMGNLAWHKPAFPAPRRMIRDFARDGVKTVLITEPFVLHTSDRWGEALRRNVLATDADGRPHTWDFFFGHTGLIDIFDPKARAWFWTIYRDLAKQGVAGWWGDLGEPEVHPSTVRHANGTADEVHNIYGHYWAGLVHEGYRRDFPDMRPFILMRAGYAGSQRFGLIPWSGDVNRTWGGLQSQPEIALSMGMQGLAYMHSDLGGFASANLDDELYVRWLQYGVFQPVFRPHAQEEVASEPVFRAAKAKALAKAAIELRYRMLPYNYTLAYDNHMTGMPLMRPLTFAEPDNPALRDVADTYLWGDAFLVAPVLHKGQAERTVVFPRGSRWFDFHGGAAHEGGGTATVATAPDRIPVFVRAGSFVPMSDVVQTTRDYSARRFTLHYWHDESVNRAAGKLYDDDGLTADAAARGKFALLRFAGSLKKDAGGGTLTVSLDAEHGKRYRPVARSVTLAVHNIAARPAAVTMNGRSPAWRWSDAAKTLEVDVEWPAKTRREVVVALGR